MIVGIGCDIVEHDLTAKLQWDRKPELLSRIFSEKETENISQNNLIRFLSGRFAAKEAVLKAIGVVMEDGVSMKEIQITHSVSGQPKVELVGRIKDIATVLGINSVSVTISHSEKYSISFAIAEKISAIV